MSDQTDKQPAIKALSALPENATFDDAIERLCFLAKIAEALSRSEAGENITHEARRHISIIARAQPVCLSAFALIRIRGGPARCTICARIANFLTSAKNRR